MYKYFFVPLTMTFLMACTTHTATSGRVVIQDEDGAVDIRFTDRDRALIGDYYKKLKREKRLPPGLAKRGGSLPHGLAKRDRLPPGLQSEPLPYVLNERLSPLSPNYVRLRIGNDIVLLEKKTRVILDVIYEVPPG